MDFLRKTNDAMERLQAHGLTAHKHVAIRAAVLLGDENIVYLDSGLGRTADDRALGGDSHIFTSTRVIRLRLHASTRSASDAAASSVEAYTWSRATLERLEVVGGDQSWADDVPTERLLLGMGYKLTYRNGETINVPTDPDDSMKPQREQALHLLPSLLDDLVPGARDHARSGRL